jgi:hypothetical protein
LIAVWSRTGAGAEVLIGERLVRSRHFEVGAAAAEIANADHEAAAQFALNIQLVLQELRGVRILVEEVDGIADISLGSERGSRGLRIPVGKGSERKEAKVMPPSLEEITLVAWLKPVWRTSCSARRASRRRRRCHRG